jgi:hypothetical protein
VPRVWFGPAFFAGRGFLAGRFVGASAAGDASAGSPDQAIASRAGSRAAYAQRNFKAKMALASTFLKFAVVRSGPDPSRQDADFQRSRRNEFVPLSPCHFFRLEISLLRPH